MLLISEKDSIYIITSSKLLYLKIGSEITSAKQMNCRHYIYQSTCDLWVLITYFYYSLIYFISQLNFYFL